LSSDKLAGESNGFDVINLRRTASAKGLKERGRPSLGLDAPHGDLLAKLT
jgi:hypothetical protein